jgi:hypothetical protein
MAATKKGGAAKKAVKKAAPKAAAKKSTAKKTTKKAAPKGATKKAKAKAKAKKTTSVKLSAKQVDALKKVHGGGMLGYFPVKGEARSLDSLVVKKLLKRGAKNKTTGSVHYFLTKLGVKHAMSPAPAPAS